jgi:hypothetical protein
MRVELGNSVRAARIEGRGFILWNRPHLTEHFGCRGLVESYGWVHDANRFQQVHRAQAGNLRRGNRLFKRYAHETLRSQVVHLGGTDCVQQTDARGQVCQVVFHQIQVGMLVDAKFLDPPEIYRTGAAEGAKDQVSLPQQQFRQIGTILSGNAGDDSFLHRLHSLPVNETFR